MKKAFLLGAGLGTRLRPLTDTAPKPLVPVFHRPLAMHVLDHLASAGITEVAVNTHHLADSWRETFPDGRYRNLELTFFHEPILLETGGGIKNISDFIGDDPIMVFNGDILSDAPIAKLIAAHENSDRLATLAVCREGDARHLLVRDKHVLDIRNNLGRGEGTHQFTGIYCIDPQVLELIPANEKISIIPAFLELAKQDQLGAFSFDGSAWLDLGTRETYLASHGIGDNLSPLGKDFEPIHPKAYVDPTALIENSWIGPNAQVGAQAELKNTILWPNTEVTEGTKLTNCIIHQTNPVSGEHENKEL